MGGNTTFFRTAKEGSLTLGMIFANVFKRHSKEDTARVLTAGTTLTTPDETEMLTTWQKPFLFARFFLIYGSFLLLTFCLASVLKHTGGYYILLVGIPFLVPVTLLILVWEMNVPRNISLYEVLIIMGLGGILSILAAVIVFSISGSLYAVWAGLVEEPSKLIVMYMILRKKNYKYALNGALLGAAVGTGFAVLESLTYVISYVNRGIEDILKFCLDEGFLLQDVLENYGYIWYAGVENGLRTAVARAVTAVSGHGVFAALYGCALVKAKGPDKLSLRHLCKPEFLGYFVISILLHALHNWGPDLGLPVLLGGLLPCEYILIAAIAVLLLLKSLHIGVNQVACDYGKTFCIAAQKAAAVQREFWISFLEGPYSGQVFHCTEDQIFTIGRDPERNIVSVPSCQYVGTVHCRIEIIDGQMYITDLNSRNGTFLNERKLDPGQPVPVPDDAVIKLATADCTFRVEIR